MRFSNILERALEESHREMMSMHQRAKLVPPNATEIGKAETSGNFLKLLGQRRAPKHRRRKLKGF